MVLWYLKLLCGSSNSCNGGSRSIRSNNSCRISVVVIVTVVE